MIIKITMWSFWLLHFSMSLRTKASAKFHKHKHIPALPCINFNFTFDIHPVIHYPLQKYLFLFPGRYDLKLPEIRCEACEASWSPGLDDIISNDYWPATSHFSTVYALDILFSFEEVKMAAPAVSSQTFLRMLDRRTIHFGRVSIYGNNHIRLTQKIILWGHANNMNMIHEH